METRANYVTVGIFTLIAIVAAFGFIYWTAAIGERGETAVLRVRIPGSASGLGRGSAVLFNGVKVGDVQRVYIDVMNPTVAIADTEVDRLTPITKSSTAVIGIAGLTGQANIEIKGAGKGEPNLLDEAEAADRVAQIDADPSAVTNLLQRAQDIFERADKVLVQLEGFATEARGPLTETVQNAQKFSAALANNADGIDTFLRSVSTLSDELAGVSGKLDGSLKAAEGILKAVDPKKIETIVGNAETFSGDLAKTGKQLDQVVADARAAIATVSEFGRSSQQTLAKVDGILAAVDPAKVRSTVDNVEQVTRTANDAVASVTRAANQLDGTLKAADEIIRSVDPKKLEQVVGNVDSFTSDIARASKQIDTVVKGVQDTVASIGDFATRSQASLGKVDTILDSVDPAKVRSALSNVEQATRNANAAVADVSKVTEKIGRRADDIDRIVSNATELSQRLNAASVRVDGILVKVDNLLGSDETEGLVSNANETLRSIKQVADTLNARLGVITDGLARFSGQGLREVEALVQDGRRSIIRIEQAISAFERNPQRIISGGEGGVRQYDGRARH
ncbi:MAG: MCE family protein [Rhizobiaceae bacterium]|nr:MCE family protein [Rhizobiaceae bacterium]